MSLNVKGEYVHMIKLNFPRKHVLISCLIFCVFLMLGFVITYVYAKTNNMPVSSDWSAANRSTSFLSIFINNLIVCMIGLLGVITFRIFSIIIIIFNGFSLGLLISLFYLSDESITKIMIVLSPHGIFEIPAIILSCSLGLVGFTLFKKLSVREIISNVGIILILLLMAAFIEINISTRFI